MAVEFVGSGSSLIGADKSVVRLIGESKPENPGAAGFLGGGSSLIGTDRRVEARLPIKGTMWEACAPVANIIGISRSSVIGIGSSV